MSRTLLEWARRRRQEGPPDGESLVAQLAGRPSPAQARRHSGFPLPAIEGVQSFYDLLHGTPADAAPRRCAGTACRFAEGFAAHERGPDVHCVGRCYQAPARLERGVFPIPRTALVAQPVVFRHLFGKRPPLAELYATPDGDRILDLVEAAALRGRGGAAFPTAAKWRSARAAPGDRKVVIANGDEGDPGSFVDRLLLEEDPHAVLAGMQACARAVGATDAIVYVRGEYPHAADVVRAAIAEAGRAGVLAPGLTFAVHEGAGSYVCGEETALIAAIEGLRAEPRPKPPYPTEHGLFGRPTVVQNVETLANVPELLRTGARSTTKAFSVSGAVAAPGAVEAELGIPLRRLIDDGAGGMRAGSEFGMALVGGPMGRVLFPHQLDQALSYTDLPGLGHGGVVVLDRRVSPRALAEHLFAFARHESCGTCTPCRVGTGLLDGIRTRAAMERLLSTLETGSLCGFGQGVPRPVRDLLAHAGDAVLAADGRDAGGGA